MTINVVPQETRPARLADLPKLPIFLDLKNKLAVVVGNSDAAAWKAELLAAAGAHVDVYASDPCPELLYLAQAVHEIRLKRGAWTEADLDHASIIVAEEGNAGEE